MSRWIMPLESSWWDDLDRPLSLIDQHFGMPLTADDVFSLIPSHNVYRRPWQKRGLGEERGLSTVKNEKDKFSVNLDVQQFRPDEINVKTVGNSVVVEGKHEERKDEHGYIARHFVRKYMLPSDVEPERVTSSLSSDGVLTITAPKKALMGPEGQERVVQVQQTKTPAVTNKK